MAIRDYWVYQKRNVQTPWALYIVKEYDRRYPEATTLDYTLYHEDIPNQTRSVSVVGLHFDTVSAYVSNMERSIRDYATFTKDDTEQLEREILRILNE